MNRNCLASFCLFLSLLHGGLGDLYSNPATKLLESQLQTAAHEQQQLAINLIRAGTLQAQTAANQVQVAKVTQTTAGYTLASKGLFDLNSIGNLIYPTSVRQCYQLNRFSFGDAINTAKNQAVQCITDKVNEFKSIYQSARYNIQSALDNIADGAQLIAACNKITLEFPSPAGLVAKAACFQEALVTIKSETILLPINIGKRILEATESIRSIETDISKCNLSIVEAIAIQATNAAKAIANCISANSSNSTVAPSTPSGK